MRWVTSAKDLARRFTARRDPWRRHDFPDASEIDAVRHAADLSLPAPTTEFVMFFTPRSGSSWVSDVLNRTRRIGSVGESFNPTFLPRITRSMNATTLDEYCAVLGRRRQGNGVFGFQITYHQLRAVFGSDAAFMARYPARHSVWLVRRDIVLQAVSLYKMQVTSLGHAPHARPQDIRTSETTFTYDGAEIRRWVAHIASAERGTEALIARAGLSPLRMSYERNIELNPNYLAKMIAYHIGLPRMRMKPLTSPHRRIGTDLNIEFADRFRRENIDFVARMEGERALMLDRIDRYGPKRDPWAD